MSLHRYQVNLVLGTRIICGLSLATVQFGFLKGSRLVAAPVQRSLLRVQHDDLAVLENRRGNRTYPLVSIQKTIENCDL